MIGYNIIAPCWVWPAFNFTGFSKMAGFSGQATINDVLRYLYNIFGNISIGRLLTKAELGVFSVARSLANLPSDKIGEILNHLSLASFAKLQGERDVAGVYLLKSLRLASLALFPVYLGMCAIAPELITLVLSDKWLAAIIPFQILCISSPFRMLSEMLATTSTALGEPGKNTRSLIQSLLFLPLFLIGTQYGIEGACWAWLAITLISFSLHLKAMLPVFHVSLKDFSSSFFPCFFSSIVMFSSLHLLRLKLSDSMPEWLFFIVTIVAGGLVFATTMMLFFRKYAFENTLSKHSSIYVING